MLLLIINIVTLIQLLFFILFLIIKRFDSLSNKILITFLLAQASIYFSNICFNFFDYLFENIPHLFFIGIPASLLWAPQIYLYTCSLTRKNFILKPVHLAHLIPYFILLVIVVVNFHLKSADGKREVFSIYNIGELYHYLSHIVHTQILLYIVPAILRLRHFRKQLKENYSEIEKINLSWLSTLLYSYLVVWLSDVIRAFTSTMHPEFREILDILVFVFFFIFFNIIVFKALSQPEIFSGIKYLNKHLQKRSLSAKRQQQYKQQLEEYIREKKPYLKPAITLGELSALIAIPPRSLSEVIKDCYNLTFFDFINDYRIAEVERILQNSTDKKITISEAFYKAGFNSKSAFYNAYKKSRGHSPSKFRNLPG